MTPVARMDRTDGGQRGRHSSAPCWGLRSLLPASLLLGALLATGCGGAQRGIPAPEEPVLVDYRARHERMLDTVVDRPGRLARQLETLDADERARYLAQWEQLRARQAAYRQRHQAQRAQNLDQFLRMVERQQKLTEARERDVSERWAQYVEEGAPAEGGN